VRSTNQERWLPLVLLSPLVPWLIAYGKPTVVELWSTWRSWHSPPGFYVAILGALGVAMAVLIKEPTRLAKALGISVVALLLFLELRALKVWSDDSDSERRKENDRFAKVLSGLEKSIENNQRQFEESERQFQKQESLSDQILHKTSEAVNASTDAAMSVTGGSSWGYVDLFPDYEVDQVQPKFVVMGKYPMSVVQIIVVDYRISNAFYSTHKIQSAAERRVNPFTQITNLPEVPTTGTWLTAPCGIDPDGARNKDYDIVIHAKNGSWKEYLRFRKLKGKWHSAIKVVPIKNNREVKKPLMERVDLALKKNGKMYWDE
jgi:hypothetical protein